MLLSGGGLTASLRVRSQTVLTTPLPPGQATTPTPDWHHLASGVYLLGGQGSTGTRLVRCLLVP